MEGLLGDLNLSESLTETGQTESLDRYEFANRLANQHSALGSLGQVQTGMKPDPLEKDPKVQTGTLEGLEEIREAIEAISEESNKGRNSTESDDPKNDQSKSESIFSDASNSDSESKLSESPSESEKSNNFEVLKDSEKSESLKTSDISDKTEASKIEEKTYSESFENSQNSENQTEKFSESDDSKNGNLLYAFDLQPAESAVPSQIEPKLQLNKSLEDLLKSSGDSDQQKSEMSENKPLEESLEKSESEEFVFSNQISSKLSSHKVTTVDLAKDETHGDSENVNNRYHIYHNCLDKIDHKISKL